jgi:predicted nucleotidyltransferase
MTTVNAEVAEKLGVEVAALEAIVRQLAQRKAYNGRPEVVAKRKAYNRQRAEETKVARRLLREHPELLQEVGR